MFFRFGGFFAIDCFFSNLHLRGGKRQNKEKIGAMFGFAFNAYLAAQSVNVLFADI